MQSIIAPGINDETPISNTGSNSQIVGAELPNEALSPDVEGLPGISEPLSLRAVPHVDFLTGVIPIFSRQQVVVLADFITGFLPEEVSQYSDGATSGAGLKYHNQVRSTNGCFIQWSSPDDLGQERGRLRFTIPGKYLSQLTLREQYRLFAGLKLAYKGRFTRVDLTVDYYDKDDESGSKDRLLALVQEASIARNFAGVDNTYIYEGRARDKQHWGTKTIGKTIYFGDASSDKRLRVYDKGLESKGENNCTRFELQLRDERADAAIEMMSGLDYERFPRQVQTTIIQLALGGIKFIDVKSGKRLRDRKPLAWYQQLVDMVGCAIQLVVPKKSQHLADSMNWIERQVARTVALVKGCLGAQAYYEWMRRVEEIGKKRLTVIDEGLIKSHRPRAQGFGNMKKAVYQVSTGVYGM